MAAPGPGWQKAADRIQIGCVALVVAVVLFTWAVESMTTVEPPPPSTSPVAVLPTPTPVETRETLAASTSPTLAGRWRVDVVNGPRPIIIRFSPDLESGLPSPTMADGQILPYAWQVEANARLTLFDQPTGPSAGSFDLLQAFNDPSKLDHCHVFQTVQFSAESFTIVLTGATLGPDYSAMIEPGLPPLRPMAPYPDVTVANCSG
jgi:hypothetical protein